MPDHLIERRTTKSVVKLESRDGGAKVLTGYGAVFYNAADKGTEYQLWDDMSERIMPGAFDRALRESQDVRCMYNHEQLMGRTKSGTMRMFVDSRGLGYECDMSESSTCKDVAIGIERGDISGSSFSFIARGSTWIEEQRDGKAVWIRQVTDCDLFDQGPVDFPAYESTTAAMRSKHDSMQAELAAYLESRKSQQTTTDEVDMAARMTLLDEDDEVS